MEPFLVILFLVGFHVVGFWIAVWYVFRLRKRLRCLGYCYIDMGDWGMGKILEAKEYYDERHGTHLTPFLLSEAEGQFQHKLAYHRQLFAQVGHQPPGQTELQYPIEDL